ncbi:helix-turn-helix transcriptional regulator [Hymenobacter sp. BT664]|uniref:Helix-turn-helix transcriptional regulator n=1 Tax=Hymenobacter montanus TaxID=2771359 RepID=A0A927BDB1_9BACT|nr:helix-turn-helix transcriptional regulator [Hymenobacter montanus]MBD2767893.1 helix-turn-helix transcriptional regulator [Hymenobacter montanus]
MAAPAIVPIDQRFAQLIQQFGLTKNSFAISLGKTASVIQHLIDGRNKPGYDLLCKVFEIYPNVSRDWLLLGRGPMLVSGEPAPKPITPAPAAAPEPPLEPIDLSEIEAPTPRRSGPGVAGSRLQPAEIAATLALAAAANQPIRAAAAPPAEAVAPAGAVAPIEAATAPWPPAPAHQPTAPAATPAVGAAAPPETAAPPTPPAAAAATPSALPPEAPPVAPASGPAIITATAVAPEAGPTAPPAGPSPEAYVAAALHAQHLQHQLALAELRNQHLLEQQQMLREMLALARQR